MSPSTFKTMLGFFRSLVGKYTPLEFRSESLEDIYNHLKISKFISTSGQPTEKHFSLVKVYNFENVINLAPENTENSIENETEVLSKLGMNYFHIPVDFSNPTEEKIGEFVSCMQGLHEQKVWVH